MDGHLECANCGRDVSELEDARTAGLRVFCCRRCYVFSSRTREVPAWGREHAAAWADPWEDLSALRFSELVDVLNLCLLDFARARKDLEMLRFRGPELGGQNGALDRLAAARQLTERIREVPAYYDVTAADLEAYRAEHLGGMARGDFDLELVRVPGDSLSRPFLPHICVAFLAMRPLETPQLISRVDQTGPQVILDHVRRQDAEGLNEGLQQFGFTLNIRQSPADDLTRDLAPSQKAITADASREAARQDGS